MTFVMLILGGYLHQECTALYCSLSTPGRTELSSYQYPSCNATGDKVSTIRHDWDTNPDIISSEGFHFSHRKILHKIPNLLIKLQDELFKSRFSYTHTQIFLPSNFCYAHFVYKIIPWLNVVLTKNSVEFAVTLWVFKRLPSEIVPRW